MSSIVPTMLALAALVLLACEPVQPPPTAASSSPPAVELSVQRPEAALRTVTMGEDSRQGFLLSPSLSRWLELDLDGASPVLHLAYGSWAPEEGRWGCGEPVELLLRKAGEQEPIFRASIPEDAGHNRSWTPLALPLEGLQEGSVRFGFELRTASAEASGGLNCMVAVGDLRLVSGEASAPPSPRRPDIWFVVIDTLRADHLGHVSPGLVRTPALDALAGRGLRFDRARSPSSYTIEAMISIFAGDYVFLDSPVASVGMPPSDGSRWAPSVVQLLAAAGYRTMGLYANRACAPGSSIEQGFGLYRYVGDPGMPKLLPELLERQDPRQPRFVYLHLMSPHDPYEYHSGITEHHAQALGVAIEPGTALAQPALLVAPGRDRAREDRARALYRGEVEYTDGIVGELLELLAQQRQDREVWLYLTADHGEEFWEHGSVGHARTLFDEVVHVPLLVEPQPGAVSSSPGRTLAAPVSTIDLAHTWLEQAALPPPDSKSGRSLVPLLAGGAGEPDRAVASSLFHYGPVDMLGLVRGDEKLLLYDEAPVPYYGEGPMGATLRDRGLPMDRLDLAQDPAELAPLDRGEGSDPRTELAGFFQLAVHGTATLLLSIEPEIHGVLGLTLDHPGIVRARAVQGIDHDAVRSSKSTVRLTLPLERSERGLVAIELSGLTERQGDLELRVELDGEPLRAEQGVWIAGATGGRGETRIPSPWSSSLVRQPCPEGTKVCLSWDAHQATLPCHRRLPEGLTERLEALGYVE